MNFCAVAYYWDYTFFVSFFWSNLKGSRNINHNWLETGAVVVGPVGRRIGGGDVSLWVIFVVKFLLGYNSRERGEIVGRKPGDVGLIVLCRIVS